MSLYVRKSDKKEFLVLGNITIIKGDNQTELYIYSKIKKNSNLGRERICDVKTFLEEHTKI